MDISIYNNPWRYAVTDNLVDDSLITSIQGTFADHNHQNHYYIDHPMCNDFQALLKTSEDKIFNNLNYWFSLFPQHKIFNQYEMLTYVSRQLAGHEYRVHDEDSRKAISFVTYIWPKTGHGTSIHKTANKSEFFDIPWKIGRSFIFSGISGKTWHSYRSGDTPRITLNHFVVQKGTANQFKPDHPGA